MNLSEILGKDGNIGTEEKIEIESVIIESDEEADSEEEDEDLAVTIVRSGRKIRRPARYMD